MAFEVGAAVGVPVVSGSGSGAGAGATGAGVVSGTGAGVTGAGATGAGVDSGTGEGGAGVGATTQVIVVPKYVVPFPVSVQSDESVVPEQSVSSTVVTVPHALEEAAQVSPLVAGLGQATHAASEP